MFKAWMIIILFYLGGLVGVLGFIAKSTDYYRYHWNSEPVIAELVPKSCDLSSRARDRNEPEGLCLFRFTLQSGQEVIARSYLPLSVIERLESGERLAAISVRHDPQSIRRPEDVAKLPTGILDLLLGALSVRVGIWLMKRRFKWFGYTRYLGHGDLDSGGT